MCYSEFPQAQFILHCTSITICNYCGQNYLSGDKLYAGGNDEQQKHFCF